MLSLSVAHLRVLRESSPTKRLVWVDIGGGTGLYPSVPILCLHLPLI
jgi:betaine lipid synthase